MNPPTAPVVRSAHFVLAHVPGLVPAGSKPRREIAQKGESARADIVAHLRAYSAAVSYAPHQVMIGRLYPEALREIARPWHAHPISDASSKGSAGEIVDERTFYAELARGDSNKLVVLSKRFAVEESARLEGVAITTANDDQLERHLKDGAEPLHLLDSGGLRLAGVVLRAHDQDESLSASVLLENLCAKVSGALAVRSLLESASGLPPDFFIGCGEEAVGDRYQRGGGNLAKAIAELAGAKTAGAIDVKSFCASPVHAMLVAGALVAAGVYRRVIVAGGGSLAKLGMKYLGHLGAGYPILEDVLAGVAIEIVADDGSSPRLRLDASAVHKVGDGSAPHQLASSLTLEPLRAIGLSLQSIDRYAVELHNPDITEVAGSGDVPANNYRIIAALAVQAKEITREQMPEFERARGLIGFAPTQGHIASAIPYLPHAIRGLTEGSLERVQFVAKGSLFLGRMTSLGDGASFVLERNPSKKTTDKGVIA